MSAWVEINQKNLIHNINCFKQCLRTSTKFAGVIKANAYGHNAKQVAKIIENHVDYFQVDDIYELKELREVSQKETFVFGYVMNKDLEELVKLNGIPGIYSLEQVKLLNRIGQKNNRIISIHICIDSKFGRDGIMPNEIENFLKDIINFRYIKIQGFYSHFANIEEVHDKSHAKEQINTFNKVKKLFRKYGYINVIPHISATAGILEYEQYSKENKLVRLGIGLYGLWPSQQLKEKYQDKINLKPVMAIKSIIAQIKTLPKNHPIGYGLTFVTKKEMKIGIVPFGYDDGIPRSLSNKGYVLVQGKRCRILGRISMNMMAIDLSDINNVNIEDEVVILGKQNHEEITAEEIASIDGTINYEIVSRINPRLETRVV